MACFSSYISTQRLEDGLVAQIVKDLGARLELLDALAHAIVGRKQDAPEHALLGLDGMRRQAVDLRRGLGKAGLAAAGLLQIGGAPALSVTESIMAQAWPLWAF